VKIGSGLAAVISKKNATFGHCCINGKVWGVRRFFKRLRNKPEDVCVGRPFNSRVKNAGHSVESERRFAEQRFRNLAFFCISSVEAEFKHSVKCSFLGEKIPNEETGKTL